LSTLLQLNQTLNIPTLGAMLAEMLKQPIPNSAQ
jgi:hypothetical protein